MWHNKSQKATFMANILSKEKQEIVIGALAEGNSIRSIERLSGIHRDTIMRLGVRVGTACKQVLDQKMRDLNCSRIEVDEVWGFIGKKHTRTSEIDRRAGLGDVWTFLSIDPITKLMPSFLVGRRDHYHATFFMEDLASRLNNRIQLSSDALGAYADAVERAFGASIDYAQIVKEYSSPSREDQRKYSPARLTAVFKTAIVGDPNPSKVCTSYIRKSESDRADALQTSLAPYTGVQQETRKLQSGDCAASGILQLRENARLDSLHARNGSRDCKQRVERGKFS